MEVNSGADVLLFTATNKYKIYIEEGKLHVQYLLMSKKLILIFMYDECTSVLRLVKEENRVIYLLLTSTDQFTFHW